MIPKDCKRLAEVEFPVSEVSRYAVSEKTVRHGHPSTLHLWWARRPLASSRAVLLGLLWPDPCDKLCPAEFTEKARALLPTVQGAVGPSTEDLRKALLKFIADFANWDRAANPSYLAVSRALVNAAHGAEPPLVVDPFAGGGSIPLEAVRLGCDAFASDLNPVACLILKVMLENIPRHGPNLAEELRRVGTEVKRQAEKRLTGFFPKDPDGATPIAYLWARTVNCESPNCGAEIPLVRSFWLCKKKRRRQALRHRVERPSDGVPRVEFQVFDPKSDSDVPSGTVTRLKATCIACGTVLPSDRVRVQLFGQRGGADVIFDRQGRRTGGSRLLAVVTAHSGKQERQYRLPIALDYERVWAAQDQIAKIIGEWESGDKRSLCPVPIEKLPPPGTLGFRVQRYGILEWGDLFTSRQKLVLVTLGSVTRGLVAEAEFLPLLALMIGRQADYLSSLCTWHYHNREKINHTFSRQALPFVTDFVETVFSASGSGGWDGLLDWSVMAVRTLEVMGSGAITSQADAAEHPLPDQAARIWFTDPPYYDAVPYADLSDFFFVWLKRVLPGHSLLRDPFDHSNPLTPKRREAVQDETRHDNGRIKDRVWFEEAMTRAFAEGRRVLAADGIGSVVFAHKTTEGWEALLSGMIRGGWTITGSWPIATEMATRLRARESAALATSVHLVCRPRADDAQVGDWEKVLRELPRRVGDWMEHLQEEGIRGADLVFACIGPALEIFSRYTKVETAEGREVPLAEYLEKVWEVVGRSALGQVLGTAEARARNGAAGAVEEDARLTALFLWSLQSTIGEATDVASDEGEEEGPADEEEEEESSPSGTAKGYTLVYDVVRRFAQPLGIDLPKWDRRVIEIKKGVVRLLPIAERAKQLFGEEGAQAVATRLERDATARDPLQGLLFPEARLSTGSMSRVPGRGRGRRLGAEISDENLQAAPEATILDRVHVAMLLQAGGRANALRALLSSEQERGPDFLRLANALSALYPKGSEEKRLLDAMLLAVPR
jgi:putative DNA methylase